MKKNIASITSTGRGRCWSGSPETQRAIKDLKTVVSRQPSGRGRTEGKVDSLEWGRLSPISCNNITTQLSIYTKSCVCSLKGQEWKSSLTHRRPCQDSRRWKGPWKYFSCSKWRNATQCGTTLGHYFKENKRFYWFSCLKKVWGKWSLDKYYIHHGEW